MSSQEQPGRSQAGEDGPCPDQGPAQERDWAQERRRAAAERARMLQERQAAEEARAARIVALFLTVARDEGLEPVELRARGYRGGTARTGLRGWYLRGDRTVALGEDGGFYVLSMPLGARQRLLGARPVREPVPMTIGEGGRDGDIVPLRFALDRLLPGWEERSPEPLV
ncbi:hypothetical protein [Actinomyces capricornis]|uniref:Uncharacterized protein n=1 Tax=Actinomyces capricornis TaxID=2755559 RepID=A0ABN6K1K8_9ACTO|nr:hypothetical protein [Actinomyces capricornis]BDA63505.1 hypothetical protein MANAM107_03390 [Actinomyces capricornis]